MDHVYIAIVIITMLKDCPTAEQFSNDFYEHMNTQFSRPKNEPYCDSYNPGWSNQSNISWQAQAIP
jgi:hypothetical protein